MDYDFEYPLLPERIPDPQDLPGRYDLRFARNHEDLDTVLALRYRVFNLEMSEGLEESERTQRDFDKYDPFCHHLMVRLKDTAEVIGTYRLQTREAARLGHGFYTSDEFAIEEDLPQDVLDKALELGRACIHGDHRNGKVLFRLWAGLMQYLKFNRKQYFFGCCSLTSQDPEEGIVMHEHLREQGFLWDEHDVRPQPEHRCEIPEDAVRTFPEPKIPQLMRIYLNYGVKMASAPAIDRAFKTIDFLALADRDQLRGAIFRQIG